MRERFSLSSPADPAFIATLIGRRPGEHRLPCPHCAAVKRRSRDDALAVRLAPDGAVLWLCHRCGWRGGMRPRSDRPTRLRRRTEPSPPPPTRPAEPDDPDLAERIARAQALWRETVLVDAVPAALAYLRHRGFDPDMVDRDRLRAHPSCPRPGHGRGPAIVAPVNDPRTGYVVGVWRIGLDPDGRKLGRYGLGRSAGCASRLWHVTPGEPLAIAEGLEDAIAAHVLLGIPAWAALSAGNLAKLELPEHLGEVTIIADADDAGRRAARALYDRLRRAGRPARILEPSRVKDANELLLAGGRACPLPT